jgi:ubiquinone/menaquinone biosynthesis C-methylase UbiE
MSGKIYALDVNPLAIKSVKALAARHKLANVATILSDGPTGLRDTSVDAALLYDILHHLKNAGNILKELHRILKPDGILSVSDHHMKADDITSRITGTGLFQTGPKGKTLNFTRVR